MHCRAVDVDVADGVAFEFLLRLVALHARQTADVMALQASMQRRTRQMWDARLQGVETVIEWRQRVAPESDNHGFLLDAENCRMRFLRTHPHVLNRLTLAPLGDGLDVDAQLPAQRRVRSLRFSSLCCANDCQPMDRCIAALTACVPSRQICLANRLPGNSAWRCREEFVP